MGAPYRNDLDVLQQRKASLQGEIARLREQTSGLDELRLRERELAHELASVEGRLDAGGAGRGVRPLPLLDQVRVASPCNADWNEMLGDDRVRFCLGCEKNVYNLSSLPREDAEALLRARMGGEMCVRFFERADGTILTQDCPVGVKKKQRRKLALAVAGAGVMAAAAATMFFRTTQGKRALPGGDVRMGEMTAFEPPVAPTGVEVPPEVPPLPQEPPPREVKGERIPVRMGLMAPTPRPTQPKGRTPLTR